MNINNVTLYGNICSDVDIKQIANTTLYKFSLAVDNSIRKANGELKKDTMFISCISFNDKQCQELKKGGKVFVAGRLKLESWEKDGKKFSKHVVQCEVVLTQQMIGEQVPEKETKKAAAIENMINNFGTKTGQTSFADDLPF
jgi:single stranded DNA-binding protein